MPNHPSTLDGAVVVVTGASSGFGRGAALDLAKQGAKVVLAARRADVLDEVVAEIEAGGGTAMSVPTDVSDAAQVEALAQAALDAHGRFDVWVNNVGIGALGYFWDVPMEVHKRTVDVNLTGLMYGCHVALGQFAKQAAAGTGGTLVNVGSVDSEIAIALQNSYAATKAGVLSLARSLNTELELAGLDDAIKVATVMPWGCDTPWFIHAANYSGHAPRLPMLDDPQVTVDVIVKACTEPREEMPAGLKAKGAVWSENILPELVTKLSGTIFKADTEKGSPRPHHNGTLFETAPIGDAVEGNVRKRMALEDEGKTVSREEEAAL